jgi:ribosomal protein S16
MLACVKGSLELTEILLPHVEDINKTDNIGLSALTYAKLTKNKSLVNELKRHGAKKTPFDFALVLIDAVKNGNEELIEQLFDYFESKNKIKDIDRSSFLIAARKDDKGEIDRMLDSVLEKSDTRGKLAFSQGHRVKKDVKSNLVNDETVKPLKKEGKNIVP